MKFISFHRLIYNLNIMRPTRLNFRSPKQKTGEFVYPKVTNDGSLITAPHRSIDKKSTSFSLERRFRDMKVT